MTDGTQDQDALATAGALTEALNGMRGELKKVNAYTRRTRHIVWFTVISVILDVALSVVVAVFAIQVHSDSVTITQLHQTAVAGCQAGNVARAAEIQLWTHIAAISKPPAHLTRKQLAAEREQIAQLLAYIRHAFAPRNCAVAYRLH